MSTPTEPGPRLRLRPGALVVPDEAGELARLAVGTRIVRTAGHAAVRILRLLDGTRGADELRAELAGDGVAEGDVADALRTLQLYGLVEPAEAPHAHPNGNGNGAAPHAPDEVSQGRAFQDLGLDAGAMASVLAQGRVAVVGDGAVGAAVAGALRRYGVGSVETVAPRPPSDPARVDDARFPEADVYVVTPDPFDPAYLAWFNRVALRYDLSWLPVFVSGFTVRLGPFVLPGETACWTCYERRVESNLVYYTDHMTVRAALAKGTVALPPADNLVPGVVELAAGLAALEPIRFLAGRASLNEPVLYGRVLEYALWSMNGTFHPVLKLPRCPACGARARGFPSVRPWMQPNAELAGAPIG